MFRLKGHRQTLTCRPTYAGRSMMREKLSILMENISPTSSTSTVTAVFIASYRVGPPFVRHRLYVICQIKSTRHCQAHLDTRATIINLPQNESNQKARRPRRSARTHTHPEQTVVLLLAFWGFWLIINFLTRLTLYSACNVAYCHIK